MASVVQRADSAIHRINHYPVDSVVCFTNTYPLDSDLSRGYGVFSCDNELINTAYPAEQVISVCSVLGVARATRGAQFPRVSRA